MQPLGTVVTLFVPAFGWVAAIALTFGVLVGVRQMWPEQPNHSAIATRPKLHRLARALRIHWQTVRQLLSYGAVGISNTAITAATITVLSIAGTDAVTANATGFGLGLLNSYAWNRKFTFRSRGFHTAMPFVLAFGIAYGCNIAALILASQLITSSKLVPQAIGMVTYNLTFFVLMKIWVFRQPSLAQPER